MSTKVPTLVLSVIYVFSLLSFSVMAVDSAVNQPVTDCARGEDACIDTQECCGAMVCLLEENKENGKCVHLPEQH